MRTHSTLLALFVLLATGPLLAGCDDAEQGRTLRYEKGTYLGQADQALTAEGRESLRVRTRLQQGY